MEPRLLYWRRAVLIMMLSLLFLPVVMMAQEKPVTYSKVRIYISSPDDIFTLNEAGLVFDHIDYQGSYFDAVLNNWEVELLKKSWSHFDILVENLEAEYKARPKPLPDELAALQAEMEEKYNVSATCFEFGSMGGYYVFDEVVAKLDELQALYPNLMTVKQSIGTSIEGRPIWMVKISDNPNINENEEEVLYTGLLHAREPQGMATAMFYICALLENYGSDPVVTYLVDNRELYFIPVVNPDGYVYNQSTNPNGGGLWRKNRRDNGNGTFGVDLNRNFDYEWGYNNSGSSPNPSSETYRGTAPASEPETQAVQNFAVNHELTMTFNFHAYGNTLNFPWGYLPNFFTPDHATFVAFSQNMSQFNNYIYGTVSQTLGYVTNGYSNDWFYGEQTQKGKVFSWTVEIGNGSDGFWPNQNRIIPLAEDNLYSNFVLANGVSGGMPPIITVTLSPQNPPIVIPSGGGSFSFDVTIANNTNFTWSFDVWNAIIKPNGGSVGPTIGPVSPTFSPGQTFTGTLTQNIPAGAPGGQYQYVFNSGTFSVPVVISSDQFSFSKTAGAALSKANSVEDSDDWAVTIVEQSDQSMDLGLQQTSVGESTLGTEETAPHEFVLEQNYPNPFNPSTSIRYGLNQPGHVTLKIYNILGEEIATLVDEFQDPGFKSVSWDGRNSMGQTVSAGIYLYKMEAGNIVKVNKMLYVK